MQKVNVAALVLQGTEAKPIYNVTLITWMWIKQG